MLKEARVLTTIGILSGANVGFVDFIYETIRRKRVLFRGHSFVKRNVQAFAALEV
jgi:hypothetical protein